MWTWNTDVKDEWGVWGFDVSSVYTETSDAENVSSLSKQLEIGTFETGHNYLFYITGVDISGNPFIASNSNGYGFCATTNAAAPEISVTSGKKSNAIVNYDCFTGSGAQNLSDVLYVSGTIKSQEALSSLSYKLTVTDSNDSSKTLTKEYLIDINNTATDYSTNYTSDYCYTTNLSATPKLYNWRVVTGGHAADFSELIETGDYEISLVMTASNGADATFQRTFTLDTENPVPSLSEIGIASENNSGYWINPAKSLNLSGLVTDNLATAKSCTTWVKLVALSSESVENTNTVYTSAELSGVNKWNFTVPANSIASNFYGANLYIYSKDSAGNIGVSDVVKLTFDTIAPSGKHIYDYKKKDLIFRVGESSNETSEISSAGYTWNDSLDKDVGGKYSAGTWGNSQTITIRGDWIEDGSGVEMIYYKFFDSEPSASQLNEFLTSYSNSSDGKFAPLSENIIRRVSYTDGSGNKNFEQISSSFKTTVSGFNVGNNYLALVAVDKVGNAGLDTLAGTDKNNSSVEQNISWNKSLSSYSINVDTESPILVCSLSGQQYTNGVDEIKLSGTFTDLPVGECSGLGDNSITISVNNSVVNASVDTENGTWTAVITNSILGELEEGEQYNVNGSVSDNAGNSSSLTLFNLSFDTVAPIVKLNSPIAQSKINGKIKISGTVDYEGASPVSLTLYGSTAVPSGDISDTSKFTKLGTISDVSKIFSWSFTDIDVYSLTKVKETPTTASLYLIPVVVDSASNSTVYDLNSSSYKYTNGTNYFAYTVDMDSDRPTIKVTNLSLSDGSYILKYGENAKIEGTITDDDSTTSAIVKTFIATSSQITSDAQVTKQISGDTITYKYKVGSSYDITTLNVVTGEWTFTPASVEDGTKTVFFYIEDNAETVFYTNKVETVDGVDYNYAQPYFQFKSSAAVDCDSELLYKSDSTSPVIKNTLVQAYSAQSEEGAVDDQTNPGINLVLGGTSKRYAKFIITGEDANEIEGIRITLSYKDLNNEDKNLKIANISDYDGFVNNGETVTSLTATTWTTDYIDFSNVKTGSVTGTIEVYDKSGLLGTASPIFMVDNDGPVSGINAPSSSEKLTGSITFSGSPVDVGNAGVAYIGWLIPTIEQQKMTDSALAGAGETIWNSELDTGTSLSLWKFTLNADTLSTYDNTTYTDNISSEIYTLPFYLLVKDTLGNYTVDRSFTFKHNPDGDRPDTEISYPNAGNYGEGDDFVILGSSIRVTGTSYIPSGTTTVGSVYLQVVQGTDNIANGGTYGTSSDYIAGVTNPTNGQKVYKVLTAAQAASDLGVDNFVFAAGDDASSWWGIKVSNTTSWYIVLNNYNELNPASAGSQNYIAIRACAVNALGKVGTWTDWYYVNIDDTAPNQDATLRQWDTLINQANADNMTDVSNASASIQYKSDMYLKGDWYLTVRVTDESSLLPGIVKKGDRTLEEGTDYFASTIDSSSVEKEQYIFIPVDRSESSVSYTVVSNDTQHTISNTYLLNIDNTAPSIASVYKGSSLAKDESNRLSTTGENKIADSNYIYTLGGKVEETGSGFDRLVFYYARAKLIDGNDYDTEVILDPLISTGTSDSKALITSNLVARPFIQGTNTYYLYSKAVSGSLGSDGFTFKASAEADITDNAHIRKGGLIEVGGLLRRIDDISGGTITFDTSTGVTAETAGVTAYFPYAQIVDNTATEKTSSTTGNTFTFENASDDGDGMPETLTGSKAVGFEWSSTIHSSNISDGPATLVVLAFDKAGNVNCETYPVHVENSAPRLAKVFLGTDLNSNNKWEEYEFEGYNLYDANIGHGINTTEVKAQQKISTANFGSAFTAKNKLAVVAEIVGGNGDILMVYKREASSTDAITTENGIKATSNATLGSVVEGGAIGTVNYNNAETATSLIGYTLANYQLTGKANDAAVTDATDGSGKKASFTFWDSTDELVPGLTSQNCVLYIDDLAFDLVDSIAPRVVVNPFYWASASENSLYNNSLDNGHIELESDLSGTQALSSYGNDPKVSGKITFTGTAYDEHALKKLIFSFADFGEIDMATYDSTSTEPEFVANNGWSALSGNSGASLADGGKYEWTIKVSSGNEEQTSGYFEDTYYYGQGGHKIYWTVSVDTAQIENVAALNRIFTLKAYDGLNYSTDYTAKNTTPDKDYLDARDNHVPSYQVDVVPYVSKVYTNLAKNKVSNWSVYNRTALGHYPVQSVVSNIANDFTLKTTTSEDVTLYGFNLNSDTVKIISGTNTFTVSNANVNLKITSDASAGSLSFNVANLLSGELSLTVNGLKFLNNMNNNDAKGASTVDGTAYANWYNRQANGDTNNILTDDIYFDVWEFNDRAATPINGTATGINMEVNQITGMLNYAFANGGTFFSMGGNTGKTTAYNANNSYSSIYWAADWDTFAGSSVGFHIDDLGWTYSVTSGGDTNDGGSTDNWVLYTSRWNQGERDRNGTINGSNANRLDKIALRIGPGTFDYSLMKYRYLSSEFASTVTGNNTNLYMVYYDALTDEIRFRAGTFPGTTKQDVGGFVDQYKNNNSQTYNTQNGKNYPDYYRIDNLQVIANGPDDYEQYIRNSTNNDATNGKLTTISSIPDRTSGQYVDVAVVKNGNTDVVCVVWYDSSANALKYSYITDPITNWNSLKGTYATTGTNAGQWSTPQTIFAEGGEYCQIKADKNNHLHIAAYAGNGDVKYAYLETYLSTAKTCTVDASGVVGEHLTLDVVLNGQGHSIPYIGYYTSAIKKPKYAYLVDDGVSFEQTPDGVDVNECFTGTWEVTVVPSPSRMTTNREDKVNIGLWKNNGVIKASTTGTCSRGGTLNGYGSTNWSKTYGNGTANGILGYQISTSTGSCLETAQMR